MGAASARDASSASGDRDRKRPPGRSGDVHFQGIDRNSSITRARAGRAGIGLRRWRCRAGGVAARAVTPARSPASAPASATSSIGDPRDGTWSRPILPDAAATSANSCPRMLRPSREGRGDSSIPSVRRATPRPACIGVIGRPASPVRGGCRAPPASGPRARATTWRPPPRPIRAAPFGAATPQGRPASSTASASTMIALQPPKPPRSGTDRAAEPAVTWNVLLALRHEVGQHGRGRCCCVGDHRLVAEQHQVVAVAGQSDTPRAVDQLARAAARAALVEMLARARAP